MARVHPPLAPLGSGLLILLALVPVPVSGQQAAGAAATGPVVVDFGPTFPVPSPDVPTPLDHRYRVVFDVAVGAAEPHQRNTRLETVARFLNMHAKAGVPRENMEVVLSVHGTAGKDLLDHAGYRARHGVDNPNAGLIRALVDAGVEVALCGQTSASRGLPREELLPGVKMSLSAMTLLISLQNQGWALIPW
jgi:intracellular sulfur oxidation DsrE/DsrF family protein